MHVLCMCVSMRVNVERERKGGGERDREINIKKIKKKHPVLIIAQSRFETNQNLQALNASEGVQQEHHQCHLNCKGIFFSHKQGCIACRNRRVSMLTYVK